MRQSPAQHRNRNNRKKSRKTGFVDKKLIIPSLSSELIGGKNLNYHF